MTLDIGDRAPLRQEIQNLNAAISKKDEATAKAFEVPSKDTPISGIIPSI